MEKAKNIGIKMLKEHKWQPNDAVMFDIDDTLIFYNTLPNKPIIKLCQEANRLGYKIIIITARPDYPDNREFTENELKMHKIPFDLIFYADHYDKHTIKQQLSSFFVLSVGDLWTDLTDSLHYIKLPSKAMREHDIVVH